MAGRLFGTAGMGNSSPPAVAGFKVQTSIYGLPLPIIYGTARVAGNLIYLTDAKATPVTSGGSKSKLVKIDSQVTGYKYQAAIALALCEGPIASIGQVWRDKDAPVAFSVYQASQGWSLFLGTNAQAPWAYTTTNHPSEAFPYQLVAYVTNQTLELPNNTLSNYTWEVGGLFIIGGGTPDANPKDILTDYLTNADHGVAFPAAQLADLTPYGTYCRATGLVLSPVFNASTPAVTEIKALLEATNAAAVWYDGQLHVVPYADSAITGNGVTYTPNTTPVYDLTDNDFIAPDGTDPVQVERKRAAEAFNQFVIEFEDRASGYNPGTQEAKDQAAIEAYGLRPAQPLRYPAIKTAAAARLLAQLRLQRESNVRNTYRFTLPLRYSLLTPMDLVTITDAALSLTLTPVRIVTIDETATGELAVTAEDWPNGTATASLYGAPGSSGYMSNTQVAPGSVIGSAIFEGPGPVLSSALEIWVGAYGGANWGGCEVHMSTDNVNFKKVGSILGKTTIGSLRLALANTGTGASAYPPADTTNTLAVDLTGMGGTLASGVAADLAQATTLCFVDGEFIAFQTATLFAAAQYNLTTLARGLYGSAIPASHAIGSAFVRCDAAVLRIPYPNAANGAVVYFKFVSFNVYGQALEDIATLTSVSHTIGRSVVTTGGSGIVSPPRAFIDIVSENDTNVQLNYNGALGAGAYGALGWQTRIGNGAWSAMSFAALPSADTITRLPKTSKKLDLLVTQPDGQTDMSSYTITGSIPGVQQSDGLARGLDGSGTLISAVGDAAIIGGMGALSLGKRADKVFSEVWENDFPINWANQQAGAISYFASNVAGGIAGPRILRATASGNAQWTYLLGKQRLVYNPNRLYRITVRARGYNFAGSGPPPAGCVMYVGVQGLKADGTTQTGTSNANNYIALASKVLTNGWAEYVGWLRGASLVATANGAPNSSDPRAPAQLQVDTVYVLPVVLMNYPDLAYAGGAFTDIDYLEIQSYDEDAQDRLYNSIDSGYSLAQKVLQYDDPTAGSTLTKRPIKGYQSGTCYDGQVITFSPAFKKNPMIVFSRGNNTITNQPDSSKWTTPGSFVATKAQIEDVYAIMAAMEGTGFTCHAKLRQQGGTTPNNVDFPAGNSVTAAGTATQLTVPAAAPSSSGHYTVRYSANVTTTSNKPGIARTATLVVVINKRAGGGGGAITQLRSDTFAVTDPDGTGPYTSASGMNAFDVVATLASGDVLEVSVSSLTSSGSSLGSDSCAVHGAVTAADAVAGLSFTSGAADNFTTMTAVTPADTLRWEAFSVA